MSSVDTSDFRAAGELAGRGLAAATALIRDTHVAIARRAFTISGPAAKVAAAPPHARRRVADRPAGNVAVGALNGAWGDRLMQWSSPLALSMSVRHNDRDLDIDREAFAQAYPDATGDVVVFVHGLCETDASWRLGAREHYDDARSTHGQRLREACGLTPVYVRYNSGRHVCDNGDDLARLIGGVIDEWPVPVTRLTLVGHSMGGLVIRAACHRATADGSSWLPRVERIVYLGSPHLGAPLEVAVTALGVVLRKVPETRAIANALATRSVGIKDLRYGDIRADDWGEIADLDAWRAEPLDCVPLLDTATHYYVGATISRRHDTVAARVIGDALVPWASASGAGKRRRLALEVDRGRHLGGLHHFDLLNHPRVYAVLQEWLSD
jgi:pimeloyl-ACP methyl ester carboxylesterase